MPLQYANLDAAIRAAMAEEHAADIQAAKGYISERLTEEGKQQWPTLLHEALLHHDDAWLAEELRRRNLMRTEEQRRKPKGGYTVAKVPVTAPDTLAEGEFNRLYARGVCIAVLKDGGKVVEVYRAKEVENPRSESQLMIGKLLPADGLLEDLRQSPGVESALGLPPGPNSGLTVRKPH